MKQLILFLLLFAISCGSDDQSNDNSECDFIGMWCTEDPFQSGTCWTLGGLTFEFRENGELLQNGSTFFDWKSDDCQVIDLHHDVTGNKVQEYTVVSLTDDRLVLNIGTITELVRSN